MTKLNTEHIIKHITNCCLIKIMSKIITIALPTSSHNKNSTQNIIKSITDIITKWLPQLSPTYHQTYENHYHIITNIMNHIVIKNITKHIKWITIISPKSIPQFITTITHTRFTNLLHNKHITKPSSQIISGIITKSLQHVKHYTQYY